MYKTMVWYAYSVEVLLLPLYTIKAAVTVVEAAAAAALEAVLGT